MNNNILVELTNCDEETIEKISQYCDTYFRQKCVNKQNKRYAENQQYVGKCYELNTKDGKRFYKVVSVKGRNEARVSCLVFNEKPSAKFKHLMQKAIPHHGNEGEINFDGIYVTDVMIKTTFMCISIEDMTEISEGEWQDHLRRYIEELINFDWDNI